MRLVLIALLLFVAGPAMGQTVSPQQVLHAAVGQAIRPGMLEFKSRAGGLSIAMNALCSVPSDGTMAIVKGQFRQTVQAYGRIEFLRMGPLLEDNRVDRLLFWPDRRGIGLKQVQAILAEEDATATTLSTLRAKSVAAQGFGALEYVLFGTGAETLLGAEGAFRCAYGRAVAANIAQIAGEVATAWFTPDGVADHLMAPAPDNVDYRTETEALEALVGALAHGAEAVRDQRLLPFMARAGNPAQPKLAPFWRSGLTAALVRANLEGLRGLFVRSGVAALGEAGAGGIDQSIAIQFDRGFVALDLVVAPIEVAVTDPAQVQALNDVVSVTQMLQVLIGDQLAVALDLSVGFSALDGD